MADTLGPKGRVSVPRCSHISEGYLTRTPGVKQASYGSLKHVHTELGNSDTAFARKGCENASTRDRGRRQRSSQRPCGNGVDTAKVCQGKTLDERNNG